MNSVNIQQLLDFPDVTGAVKLPCGEFEGPFYIRKPCVVVGNNTTLWSRKGPIVNVMSNGVALKELRIEVTDKTMYPNVAVATNSPDTRFADVEILGEVTGVAGEEDEWYIPKVINLKKFPADKNNVFKMRVYVPVPVTIVCNIYDLKISAESLSAGINEITVTTEKLRPGSYIYGEILFVSKFSRRIYITGSASDEVLSCNENMLVYDADYEKAHRVVNNTVQSAQQNTVSQSEMNQYSKPLNVLMRRGERISVAEAFDSSVVEIQFSYEYLRQKFDIDPYVFLLNNNNIATSNDRLVFFGNIMSANGEVQYITENGKSIVRVDLSRVSPDVEKIAVSYSIYGDNPDNNFSKVVNPKINILSASGRRKEFCPDGLMLETTIVALEFYKYNNIWKLWAVGNGYRNGLRRLCESFGLNVS